MDKPLRVKKSRHCVICGKRDWCGISPDELSAFCMRVSEGRVVECRNGASLFRLCPVCSEWGNCGGSKDGQLAFCRNVTSKRPTRTGDAYVHRLDGMALPSATPKKPVTVNSDQQYTNLASIERRDEVLTAWLEALTLSGRHADNLATRGLSDSEVVRQLYSSAPDERTAQVLTDDLVTRFGDLRGIPGFFQQGGRWHLVKLDKGILIPARDEHFRIQALRLRRDVESEDRYIWVSSNPEINKRYRDGGTGSGAPWHFSRSWRIERTSRLIISEGELKAEVIAQHLDDAVLSLPGVSTFKASIGEDLRRLFPTLERVAIAYDADFTTNAGVLAALLRLGRTLGASGMVVSKMSWPATFAGSRAKGLDDYLSLTSI